MDVSPEYYNTINGSQLVHGVQIIKRIKKENKDENFDLILDVGCGTGNLTLYLAKTFENARLVGIDAGSSMINYAKENNSNEKTNYIIVDIEKPWDQLPDQIKTLKGKFSLGFSNIALHWITNREKAAENISLLLKPGGKFYANCLIFESNVFPPDMTKDEKEEFEKIIHIPNEDEQVQLWVNAFEQNNMKVNDIKKLYECKTMTEEYFNKFAMPSGLIMMRKFFNGVQNEDEYFIKFLSLVNRNQSLRNDILLDLSTINPLCQDKYGTFNTFFEFVAQK